MKTKVKTKLSLTPFIKGIIFLLAFSTLQSCNSEGVEVNVKKMDSEKDKALIEFINQTNNNGIPFPEGSKAFKLKNGNFRIVLPENQRFIFQELEQISSISEELADIEVSCGCSDGKGCSPLKNGDKYYCIMESSCRTCDMRVIVPGNRNRILIKDIINYNQGVSVITKKDKKVYKPMKSYVLELPKVQSEIYKFYAKMFREETAVLLFQNKLNEEDYLFAKVNIYGFAMMLPVVKKSDKNNNTIFLEEIQSAEAELKDVGDIKCSCEDKPGSDCTKTKGFGGYYCKAGLCQDCKLID